MSALQIPYSTLFVVALAAAVSLATNLLNRKFMNKKQMAEWQSEVNRWNADKKLAKKTNDRKLLVKVKKQEARITQIQSKMLSLQTKTFLISYIPLILIWQVLIGYFGSNVVAYLPDGIFQGPVFALPFFYWYMVCSFFISTLISHLLGVGTGMGLGMGLPESK